MTTKSALQNILKGIFTKREGMSQSEHSKRIESMNGTDEQRRYRKEAVIYNAENQQTLNTSREERKE